MSLPCQRDRFEIPSDVAYFNAAGYAAIPREVREAGEAGVASKGRPWAIGNGLTDSWAERARAVAARLVGAAMDDIAVCGSVSHGLATALANVEVSTGTRVVSLAGEHSSANLACARLAAERGLEWDRVRRPADGDWTAAVLAAITRPSVAPLGLAVLSPLHWTDGSLVDLVRLAPAIHAQGAAFVVDATQAVGAMPVDVGALRPDFLVFPSYKWLVGPYSLAFLYAAPHRQRGRALDPNNSNHADGSPVAGARRYDQGERNNPVALPMAATGMELVESWGVSQVAVRLRAVTDEIANRLHALGLPVSARALRVGHILGVPIAGALPVDVVDRLAAAGVHVADRSGFMRISPHVWVDEGDVDRLLNALASVAGRCVSTADPRRVSDG